jgi:putative photosynthetic complex assembly protein 2
MNALFPVSVTGGTIAVVVLVQHGLGASDFEAAAFTLVAALMALAVIEHWFLMLPLPLDGLWTWGRPGNTPNHTAPCPTHVDTARLPLRP